MLDTLSDFLRTLGHILLILVLAGLGAFLNSHSFDQINRERQLERVPPTEALAVLPGVVAVRGEVFEDQEMLNAPRSNTPCVYYRYVVEEERRDSDGDVTWHTITDEERWVNFLVGNERGRIPVHPGDNVRWSLDGRSYYDREGKYRYSEYRLETIDEVYVFGLAAQRGDALQIEFHQPGPYTPIISMRGELDERQSMATNSVLSAWGSMVCLSLLVVAFCSLFRIHQVMTYQGIVAIALVVGLIFTGVTMLKRDLEAAHSLYVEHHDAAIAEFEKVFGGFGHTWDGDFASISGLDDPRIATLPDVWKQRLTLIWRDLSRAATRTNRLRGSFPETMLAPLWGVPYEDPVPMPDEVAAEARAMDADFKEVQFSTGLGSAICIIALPLGLFLSYLGFRLVKVKRYIENLPTSSARGTAYGLTELSGVANAPVGFKPLEGPVSRARCVHYHYRVDERRGSGKNQKWVNITDEKNAMPFSLIDDSGDITVHPWGAEISTIHNVVRREGRLRYSEKTVRIGDKLYILGSATLNPQTMENLIITRGDKEFPYILSNYSEGEILFEKGRLGLFTLNCSLNAIIGAAIIGFAMRGGFAATDYLAAAIVGLIYLFVMLVLFMYNDIVFLHNLVKRNFANIDVSLKKRADLIPRLENVVKGYMSHERDLLEAVTAMRHKYGGGALPNLAAIGQFMEMEENFLEMFQGRKEAYPDLKADETVAKLSQRLVELENEIALMRDGYNQVVKSYNQRIMALPDVILARLFHFDEAEYLKADTHVHRVPKITLDDETGQPGTDIRDGAPPVSPSTASSNVAPSIHSGDTPPMGTSTVDFPAQG